MIQPVVQTGYQLNCKYRVMPAKTDKGVFNCGCTNIPEPKFSFNKSTPAQVSFTYTGSSGYSSIKWDFDDGNTSIQANPSHTYTAIYPYTVCVTVTNSCGDNTYCANIPMWPAGVNILMRRRQSLYIQILYRKTAY